MANTEKMKFTAEKSHLVNSLESLPSISRGVTQEQNTIRIEVKSKLTFTVRDENLRAKTTTEAEVQEEGEVHVIADDFVPLIKSMPGRRIEFELKGESLFISSKGTKAKLIISSNEGFQEFQEITEKEKKHTLEISTSELREMLGLSTFCIGASKIISSVVMSFCVSNDQLSLVAWDNDVRYAFVNYKEEKYKQYLVPEKAVIELTRIVKGAEKEVTIEFSDKEVSFTVNETKVICSLYNGKYEHYKKLVSLKSENKVLVNRRKLLSALYRAKLISKSDYPIILRLSTNKLNIISNNPSTGKLIEELSGNYSGGNMVGSFDSSYLIEVLEVLKEPNVEVEIVGKFNPLIVKAPGYKYIVYSQEVKNEN